METKKELNSKIIGLTNQIRQQHPELSKLLAEMPMTIPNESNPEVTVEKLDDYYESLKNLLKNHNR